MVHIYSPKFPNCAISVRFLTKKKQQFFYSITLISLLMICIENYEGQNDTIFFISGGATFHKNPSNPTVIQHES